MITSTGLRMIQEIITSGDHAHITHLNIGSGTDIPTVGDTGLQFELGTRREISYTTLGSPIVGDTYYATWDSIEAGAIGSVSECGLFSALTTGSLFSRASFDTVEFSDGSEYKLEWEIRVV